MKCWRMSAHEPLAAQTGTPPLHARHMSIVYMCRTGRTDFSTSALRRIEVKTDRVEAEAFAGRRRTVVEDMAQMCAT